MPHYEEPPPVTYLNGLEPSKTIYRVFDRAYVDQLVTAKQMALVRPEQWNDPFENLLHQGSVYVNGIQYGLDPIRRSYFAQCWSLKAESDAMWRIYSEDGRGVRIKTTVEKLGKVLLRKAVSLGQQAHAFHKCFVGKVEYSDMASILAIMNNSKMRAGIFEESDGKKAAQSLLHKREAFDHEQEVRAIYNNVGEPDRDLHSNVMLFDISDDFIEEICIHPRMVFDFEEEKKRLLAKGVTAKIVCSDLYAPLPDDLLWHHANNPT